MQVCKYAVQKYTSMQICKYASIQLCKLQVNLRPISGKSSAYRRHTSGRYQTNLSLISSKSQTYIRHFCKFVYNPHEREREREREREVYFKSDMFYKYFSIKSVVQSIIIFFNIYGLHL